jgi:glycine betaine/proline transport system substrate-binding protein
MKKRLITTIALGTVAILGLSACSAGTDSGSDSGPANDDKTKLTIGVFNGWPEGEAASYLWKSILDEKGYDVELKYADAGPVFAGLSTGDYDLALDGWLPTTHAKYMKKFGDKIDDLGTWNSDAKLTVAVNKDAPIDSLTELAANADKFGDRIVGIEPGAGLTGVMNDKVIPDYGLEKMKFITSSTPAMLTELKAATEADKNIVVTLWRPQWAYDAFPIKDLKDPKGALGDAESIHSLASLSFAKDFPTLAKWITAFTMKSDLLFSLENVMYNNDDDIKDYTPIVDKWIKENQDYVDGLTA